MLSLFSIKCHAPFVDIYSPQSTDLLIRTLTAPGGGKIVVVPKSLSSVNERPERGMIFSLLMAVITRGDEARIP